MSAPPLPSRTPAFAISREAWTALNQDGFCVMNGLLSAVDCEALGAGFGEETHFRTTIDMQRHGYGRGRYRYYRYPLPQPIAELRQAFYGQLYELANQWRQRLQPAASSPAFPNTHAKFLARCHEAGQQRPTPLLLTYGPGDYNHLHQDLYGAHYFPLQVAVLLNQPDRDFTGGEFVLTEQCARMQAKVSVVPLQQGDAVIFATHERPVPGKRGDRKARMRHGVSPVRMGQRVVLGLIFHDAT